MTENLSFGPWLKQRRRILDLTQTELAERVACARVTVQKIESGRLRPSRHIAERFLSQLGIPPDEQPAFVQWARHGACPPGMGYPSEDILGGDICPTPQPPAVQGAYSLMPAQNRGGQRVMVMLVYLTIEAEDSPAALIATLLSANGNITQPTLAMLAEPES